MALPKSMTPQTDFSAGQLNLDMKRSEEPVLKSGVRRMVNYRIRNSKRIQQRPGRRVLYSQDGRVDVIRMNPINTYHLAFHADGTFSVRFAETGTIVPGAVSTGHPWNASTVDLIRWDVFQNVVVVCYPGMPPFTATLAGGAWFISDYAVATTAGGQKRMPFYRIAPRGITLTPSANTGSITISFSQPYLVNDPILGNMVGNVLRYAGRQLTITGIASSVSGSAVVNEALAGGQLLDFGSVVVNTQFHVGDVLIGGTSGAKGQVASFPAGNQVNVVLLSDTVFQVTFDPTTAAINGEQVSGPTFSAPLAAVPAVLATPPPTTVWDEEVFNNFRGWPQSVAVDQGRLIFCDLPAVPQGIAWSAYGVYDDLYVGANPTDAMFELAPKKGRVLNVSNISAAAGDEIVLMDNGVWMIPVSPQSPLKPGNVTFQLISPDGASALRPALTAEGLVYVNAGRTRVIAIFGSGFPTRPYNVVDMTERSYEILTNPRVIATSTGDGQFPERYIYIQQLDGSVAVGRYDKDKGWCGWAVWRGREGVTSTQWVSAHHDEVLFTTIYATGGLPGSTMVEKLDDRLYLDSAMPYNNPPVNMIQPGLGKVWWQPGGQVDLMDGHTPLGTRHIDGTGNIIVEPGDDLSSPTLMVGVPYVPLVEPFVPLVAGGQSQHQRLDRRRISLAAVSVENSTGFLFRRLWAGPEGSKLPGNGTPMAQRRIPTWYLGDIQSQPPRLREETYTFRPLSRAFDPRIEILKDVPGPIRIIEIGIEVNV